jgi:hypothetical protein
VDTGRFEPVGIPENEPAQVAAGELELVRRQRDRLLRELDRLDRRLESAELGTPEAFRGERRDLWPDDADLIGGTVIVRDVNGRPVATLRILDGELERWLVDAGVEAAKPGDGAGAAATDVPRSEVGANPQE